MGNRSKTIETPGTTEYKNPDSSGLMLNNDLPETGQSKISDPGAESLTSAASADTQENNSASSNTALFEMIESIKEVIYEIDNEGIIRYISSPVEKLTGYSPGEVIGKNFLSMIHPGDKPWIEEYFEGKSGISYPYIEFRVFTKNGELKWLHSSPKTIWKNGRVEGRSGVMIDITRQKSNEKALRKSEEALNRAQELTGMGSWETNFHNSQTIWSRNLFKIFGLQPYEIIPSFDYVKSKIHPDDLEELDRIYKTALRTGQVAEFDNRLIMADGSVKWLRHTIEPVVDNGKFSGLKGTAIDVTDKKYREEQIKLQNDRLMAIMQATPDLVFVYDANGFCREYFSLGSKKTRLPVDMIVGSSLTDVFGDKAGYHLAKFQEALKTGAVVTHEYQLDINGEPAFYEARISPLGGEVLVFARDITENKKAVNQIQILSQAVEQSPLSIIITNLDGNIEYVNPRFTELTGYAEDELIGNNPGILKSGKHPREFYAHLWKEISSGRQWRGEIRNLKKNGELYWESAVISPVKNQYGEVIKYIGLKEDITEKVKAGQQLKESVYTRDRLFSIIAHDLRGPIGNLIPMIDMIIGDTSEDGTMRNELLSDMRKAAITTFDLLENLLSWARVQSDSIEIRPSTFNVDEIIENILELYATSANLKSIHLEKNVEKKLAVYADIDTINLVVRNLVNNAIKFTHKNGVITISAYGREEDVVVEISDNGMGMSAEMISGLFQSNFSHTTYGTDYEKGSGLGLMLCREFVEKNKGKIYVESSPGVGSRFMFTLEPGKGVRSKKATAFNNPAPAVDSLRNSSILLAEDDAFSQLYGKTLLEQWGAKVDVAGDGKAAVDLLKCNKYDLVLMDLEMPVMDGFSVMQAMKHDLGMNIPAIAISASISNQIINKAHDAGFCDYIIKPGKPEELYSKIVQWLGSVAEKGEEKNIPGPVPERRVKRYSDTDRLKLAMGNDYNLVKMMMMKFLETTPRYHKEMVSAFDAGEFETVRKVSHKLKASVNLLAGNEIAAYLKLINDYSASVENHPKLAPLMESFSEWYPRLYAEIQDELANL
jgi:PAS domain S-box-containing protein